MKIYIDTSESISPDDMARFKNEIAECGVECKNCECPIEHCCCANQCELCSEAPTHCACPEKVMP